MTVRFRWEAEEEFLDAARWYDRRSNGLGIEFIESIDAAVELIERHPEQYPVVYRQTRKAVVRRFPYLILYRIENSCILIITVFHAKRDPAGWKNR